MSKVMVMFTEEKEMIDFLLFASENSVFRNIGWEGHCIFTGVPKSPDVFVNPLCEYLQSKKNIEFNAKIIATESGFSLTVKNILSAELSNELQGEWSPLGKDIKGICFAPDNAS
jgi:hypothetical protein